MKETLLPHKTNSALNLLPLFNKKKTLASLTRALWYLGFENTIIVCILQSFLMGHMFFCFCFATAPGIEPLTHVEKSEGL